MALNQGKEILNSLKRMVLLDYPIAHWKKDLWRSAVILLLIHFFVPYTWVKSFSSFVFSPARQFWEQRIPELEQRQK